MNAEGMEVQMSDHARVHLDANIVWMQRAWKFKWVIMLEYI